MSESFRSIVLLSRLLTFCRLHRHSYKVLNELLAVAADCLAQTSIFVLAGSGDATLARCGLKGMGMLSPPAANLGHFAVRFGLAHHGCAGQ